MSFRSSVGLGTTGSPSRVPWRRRSCGARACGQLSCRQRVVSAWSAPTPERCHPANCPHVLPQVSALSTPPDRTPNAGVGSLNLPRRTVGAGQGDVDVAFVVGCRRWLATLGAVSPQVRAGFLATFPWTESGSRVEYRLGASLQSESRRRWPRFAMAPSGDIRGQRMANGRPTCARAGASPRSACVVLSRRMSAPGT